MSPPLCCQVQSKENNSRYTTNEISKTCPRIVPIGGPDRLCLVLLVCSVSSAPNKFPYEQEW
eukprot:113688-Amphidinium_carterae.2